MPDLKTQDIRGVEALMPGTWNNKPFSDAMLDDIVAAYQSTKALLMPPVKLGHDDKQKLLQSDGYPAAGWVANVRRTGRKLQLDLLKVPQAVAELIKAGGYHKVSVEITPDMKVGGKTYRWVLTGLALLGADLPAVDGLAGITKLYESLRLSLLGNAEPILLEMEMQQQQQQQQAEPDPDPDGSGDGDNQPGDRRNNHGNDAEENAGEPGEPDELVGLLAEHRALHTRTEALIKNRSGAPRVRTLHEAYCRELERTVRRRALTLLSRLDMAVWSTALVNDLPDASFAVIQAGGTRDAEGKTEPRSLRHLPYKDADGKVDLPHLRNALARLPQTKGLSEGERAQALRVLEAAAQRAGVGGKAADRATTVRSALRLAREEIEEMNIIALAKAAGLPETATETDILVAVTNLAKKREEDLDGGDGSGGGGGDDATDLAAAGVHCTYAAHAKRGKHTHTPAEMAKLKAQYGNPPPAGDDETNEPGEGTPGEEAADAKGSRRKESESSRRNNNDLNPTVLVLARKVADLEAERDETKAADKVDAMLRLGKIAPAQRADYIALARETPEIFDRIMKNQFNVIKFGLIGSAGAGGSASGPINFSALEPTELEMQQGMILANITGENRPQVRLRLLKQKAADAGVDLPADFKLPATAGIV